MKVEIPKCSSPERYGQYALNVEAKEPEKAQEARRQAVRMRAELKGAKDWLLGALPVAAAPASQAVRPGPTPSVP